MATTTKKKKSLFGPPDPWTFNNYGQGSSRDPASALAPNVGNPGAAPQLGPGAKPIDYTSLIANDPLFTQAQTDFGAADISDRGQLQAALRRAAVGFGENVDMGGLGIEDPDLKSFLGGTFDQGTQGLIQKSNDEGLSLMSRLAKANKDAIRTMRSNLAARGMLESGEQAHGLAEEGLRFKQAGFDARQALLESLQGGIGGYLGRVNDRKRSVAEAMREAAARQAELLGTSAAPTVPAPTDSPGPAATVNHGPKSTWPDMWQTTQIPKKKKTPSFLEQAMRQYAGL